MADASTEAARIQKALEALARLEAAPARTHEKLYYSYYGYGYGYYQPKAPSCQPTCIDCVGMDVGKAVSSNSFALETRNSAGETLVEVAARRGLWELVSLALSRGAVAAGKFVLTDRDGELRACIDGIGHYSDIYRQLQQLHYDYSICNAQGRNVLSQFLLATSNYSASLFNTMVMGGALPFLKDHGGKTAVIHAIDMSFKQPNPRYGVGVLAMVMENLNAAEKKLCAETACECGCTPLSYVWKVALEHNTANALQVATEMTTTLVRAGADVSQFSCKGRTCVMDIILANRWCHSGPGKKATKVDGFNSAAIIETILATSKYDLNAKSLADGRTALQLAASHDLFQVCKRMLKEKPKELSIPLAEVTDRIASLFLHNGAPHTAKECACAPAHTSIFHHKCNRCMLVLPSDVFSKNQRDACVSKRLCIRCTRIDHPAAYKSKGALKYIPRPVESLQTLASLAYFQTKGACFGCLDDTVLPMRIREILRATKHSGEVWRERAKRESNEVIEIAKALKAAEVAEAAAKAAAAAAEAKAAAAAAAAAPATTTTEAAPGAAAAAAEVTATTEAAAVGVAETAEMVAIIEHAPSPVAAVTAAVEVLSLFAIHSEPAASLALEV